MHIFFSDVHLGLGSPESSRRREQMLVDFLERIGKRSTDEDPLESLWIVGDLFDYWFDYRSVIPRSFVRTLGALARLADAGVQIEYVMGNHDFGHRDFFEKEIGLVIHPGDVEREVYGERIYVAHGDGKAFNDRGYAILKKILRSPTANRLWRLLHPAIGIGIAARASRKSREHTNAKGYGEAQAGEGDGLEAFARTKIDEGFDLVVMGHNHAVVDQEIESGRYINLGAWLSEDPRCLVIDHSGRATLQPIAAL